jgi:hypothetical protein
MSTFGNGNGLGFLPACCAIRWLPRELQKYTTHLLSNFSPSWILVNGPVLEYFFLLIEVANICWQPRQHKSWQKWGSGT